MPTSFRCCPIPAAAIGPSLTGPRVRLGPSTSGIPPPLSPADTERGVQLYIYSSGEGTGFEWDKEKARTNLRRHGVDFADAMAVLGDEGAITLRDELSAVNETRFLTLGQDSLGRVLVVAFTWRGSNVRLTAARKATPGERQQYGRGTP